MQQYPIGNRFAQAMHKQIDIYVLYNDACYWCMFFFCVAKGIGDTPAQNCQSFPYNTLHGKKKVGE